MMTAAKISKHKNITAPIVPVFFIKLSMIKASAVVLSYSLLMRCLPRAKGRRASSDVNGTMQGWN
jgi:hypothetical protein